MSKPESSPTIERELRLVDEALAAGATSAADPADLELQQLALALRAQAPEPDPRFAATLRGRVEAGFPPPAGSARERVATAAAALRSPRRLLPAGGALAALLIAVAVAVSLPDGRNGDGGGGVALERGDGGEGAALGRADGGGQGGSALQGGGGNGERAADAPAAPSSALPEDAGGASVIAEPPPGRDFAPGREQRIERSAALELEAPADELERVAAGVTAIADRHDGFVLRSSFTASDDEGAGGDFELRIPARDLRPALRDLAGLATVRSRSESGQDVTRGFVSARDRLRAARAERTSLLVRLENADTDTEAEAIRARLDLVAREINGLRGQLRELRLRTSYAAVVVTLLAHDDDGAGGSGGSTREALDDALASLLGAVNLGLRLLGVALPLGIVALLGWLAARLLRRRRRESVLA